MSEPRYEIRGGAGPEVTAAIVAVISHVLEQEATAKASPLRRPRQSPWVLAGRPREAPAPLPSHTFDAPGWSEAAEAEEG
ncbi:MAG TPA: hypothetical protein VLG28_10910 [Acidimicrobiia bacterium]|jgi:hypothetical protein|nr:hypothetical protein [Acidimicrobiia bacterium]